MRNFEERMAEIKKRSNARILRRKHQIKVLCVPLISVLCISGFLMIPQITNYRIEDAVPAETTVRLYSDRVTAVNGYKSVTCNSRETVDAVRNLICSLPPLEESMEDLPQKSIYEFTFQTTSLTAYYSIILETADSIEEYKLFDNTLINSNTGDRYEITDSQRTKLLKLLELL